jgi:hypothetical protein
MCGQREGLLLNVSATCRAALIWQTGLWGGGEAVCVLHSSSEAWTAGAIRVVRWGARPTSQRACVGHVQHACVCCGDRVSMRLSESRLSRSRAREALSSAGGVLRGGGNVRGHVLHERGCARRGPAVLRWRARLGWGTAVTGNCRAILPY